MSSSRFPDNLGVIVCRCVLEQSKRVGFVSHAGGDWQMYCDWRLHDFESPEALSLDLRLMHIEHLLAQDPGLNELADLPADMAAERPSGDAPWVRYEDKDDD